MVLIANLNWRYLTRKILSSKDTENYRVFKVLCFTNTLKFGFVVDFLAVKLLMKC